ncbi:PIN domain nuclease [Actinoplanes sp. DH11]|uniref:PIN domain nuclease n=1 Tax=Actinoplanes sp. DH11 TaxID=2857011 RepID=UPI001E63E20B|nr:PIN domain nuclease [Actinoplanes sp. DH11]
MTTKYLIDTSAFMRLLCEPAVQSAWLDQIDAGVLGVCPLTELEILFTARSKVDRGELEAAIRGSCAWLTVPDRAFDRALSVQKDLTDRGAHRSAGPVDLVVAATAEHHRTTILHYDRDFEQVAAVTGQAARWVADPGSVD